MTRLYRVCGVLSLGILVLPGAAAALDDAAKDAIGAAIRVQGYACDEMKDVEADTKASMPDRPTWLVTCETGRYRVTFEGGTGSDVEKID